MPTAAMLLHLSVVILAEYIYRKIAKIPRPLLYLELQNNWRKYAKNILCYLGKILNITLIIKDHHHWVFNTTSSCLRDSTVLQMYTLLSHPPLLSWVTTIKMSCWTISFEDIFLFLSEWNTILKQSFPGRLYYGLVLNVYEICS